MFFFSCMTMIKKNNARVVEKKSVVDGFVVSVLKRQNYSIKKSRKKSLLSRVRHVTNTRRTSLDNKHDASSYERSRQSHRKRITENNRENTERDTKETR